MKQLLLKRVSVVERFGRRRRKAWDLTVGVGLRSLFLLMAKAHKWGGTGSQTGSALLGSSRTVQTCPESPADRFSLQTVKKLHASFHLSFAVVKKEGTVQTFKLDANIRRNALRFATLHFPTCTSQHSRQISPFMRDSNHSAPLNSSQSVNGGWQKKILLHHLQSWLLPPALLSLTVIFIYWWRNVLWLCAKHHKCHGMRSARTSVTISIWTLLLQVKAWFKKKK